MPAVDRRGNNVQENRINTWPSECITKDRKKLTVKRNESFSFYVISKNHLIGLKKNNL